MKSAYAGLAEHVHGHQQARALDETVGDGLPGRRSMPTVVPRGGHRSVRVTRNRSINLEAARTWLEVFCGLPERRRRAARSGRGSRRNRADRVPGEVDPDQQLGRRWRPRSPRPRMIDRRRRSPRYRSGAAPVPSISRACCRR